MHLQTAGAGPDVVLIPGAPQDPSDLDGLAAPIGAAHRVTIVHLPGYGRTPPILDTSPELDRVAAELAHDLIHAEITSPVLVGFSGGSYRALQLALDHPRLDVRGLFLMGPFAHLEPDGREALRGFGVALEAGVDLLEIGVARLFSPGWAEAHPDRAREIVARMLEAPDRRGIRAELAAFADSEDLRDRLAAIELPTTLRVGELDLASPLAGAKAIADRIAGSTLQVVRGAGHLVHHEDREATVTALLAFLAAFLAPGD